jgi:hypothetical protein
MRHPAIRLALAALAALACSTGATGAAGAAASPTRTFSGGGVSFRYPATWHAAPRAWAWQSSFTALVTYLSNGAMHDPCVRGAGSLTCTAPLDVLRPGGVLVTLTRTGRPGLTLGAGTRTTIAGRPARLVTARPGDCRYLHADETITARIAVAAPHTQVVVQACLRAGAANGARVRAMLATLTLGAG